MVPEKKETLGRLLKAVLHSPYLDDIARDARVPLMDAKKILVETANTLLKDYLPIDMPAAPKAESAPLIPGAETAVLYTDGASRGNPGPAGAGAYLSRLDGTILGAFKKYLGEATNNVAEYQALILGLEEARKAGIKDLEVRMDSELVARQLTGVYKVKHPDMKTLAQIVKAKEKDFRRVTYRHVRRELNTVADRLSNEAIDDHFGK